LFWILPRSACPASFGTDTALDDGRTKIRVQRRFLLARDRVTGLRFRFAWGDSAENSAQTRENSRFTCRFSNRSVHDGRN
jgi:hypothetical protein